MATGEGKTLVGTSTNLPKCFTRKRCTRVTVNDYLAKETPLGCTGPIYQFHGLTIDCIDFTSLTLMQEEKHTKQILSTVPTTNLALII